MCKKKFATTAISVFMALVFAVTSVAATSDKPSFKGAVSGDTEWATYIDPRFDFSVEYPTNWYVMPRDDSNSEARSGLLMFVPSEVIEHETATEESHNPHEEVPQVIIGLYLAEQEADQSLQEWTEQYEAASNDFSEALMRRQPRRTLNINGANAVREEGVSPLTTYQFTNLVHGRTVWFIWTNITSLAEDPYSSVYEEMLESFRFGRNTPTNLKQVYGDTFQPLRLSNLSTENIPVNRNLDLQTGINTTNLENFSSISVLSSAWKSPVLNGPSGPRNVRCGSEQHNNDPGGSYSKHAADIGVGSLTNVYAAMGGTVTFAGWANNGYGNLITVQASDGKVAYYAHLNAIFTGVGYQLSTYMFIAHSGNSSTIPNMPYHLHFHVRDGNSSVDLTGMSGFTNYGNYPGTPGVYENCGSMGR